MSAEAVLAEGVAVEVVVNEGLGVSPQAEEPITVPSPLPPNWRSFSKVILGDSTSAFVLPGEWIATTQPSVYVDRQNLNRKLYVYGNIRELFLRVLD